MTRRSCTHWFWLLKSAFPGIRKPVNKFADQSINLFLGRMKEIPNAVNQNVQQCDNRDINHLVDHIPLYLVEEVFDTAVI